MTTMVRDYGLGLMTVDYEERADIHRMRRERLERALAAVKAVGADLVIMFREENIRYITCYRTLGMPYMSFGMRGSILLSRGADPIFYCFDWEEIERTNPWARDWLPHPFVSTWGIGSVSGAVAWLEDVKRRLAERGVQPKRIGVDALTGAISTALGEVFPEAELLDGQAVLAGAFMVKTRDELRIVENSAGVTIAGLQAARDALQAGRRECEVQAAAYRKMLDMGAEWTRGPGVVCSVTYPYRGFATDRVIQGGDGVIVDVGARVSGYYAAVCRSFQVGKVRNDSFAAAYRRASSALEAAKSAIRPGATTRDVFLAAREHMTGDDLGCGLGISAIEPPLIGSFPGGGSTEGSNLVLQPGMVLYLAPYAAEGGMGARLGDTVAVTEDGIEVLTPYGFEEDPLS